MGCVKEGGVVKKKESESGEKVQVEEGRCVVK